MMLENPHQLLLAIGSNTHPDVNIKKAKRSLSQLLGTSIQFTPSLLTDPIGIGGPQFKNLLASADSTLPYPLLREQLKAIEQSCGDTKENRASGIVELDIDVLWHLGTKHHEKDWQRPYIKQLINRFFNDKYNSFVESDK